MTLIQSHTSCKVHYRFGGSSVIIFLPLFLTPPFLKLVEEHIQNLLSETFSKPNVFNYVFNELGSDYFNLLSMSLSFDWHSKEERNFTKVRNDGVLLLRTNPFNHFSSFGGRWYNRKVFHMREDDIVCLLVSAIDTPENRG
mmetsp:Transcript_9127/g.17163  ORF Transcript_9127/g.17163 Transcript_9127/m.17163 type:complete len:141 (-) Transcript_9127:583-1005(-)